MTKDDGRFKFSGQFRSQGWIWILAALLFPAGAYAQIGPRFSQDDTQVWTDVEATHALRDDLHLILNGGLRWSSDADHLLYRRVGGGIAYTWHKYLTFSPYYNFYITDSNPASTSHENRIALAVTVGIPFGGWTISDRNVVERRFLPAHATVRYRNRIEFEHGFHLARFHLRAFLWDEVFHDSSVEAWTRNRAAIGLGKAINHRLSMDVYYVRQNDSHTRPGDLNAIGVTLRTHF
jgi:Protein of unknown function (DUF2490)